MERRAFPTPVTLPRVLLLLGMIVVGGLIGAPPARGAAERGRVWSQAFLPADYRGEVQVSDVVQATDGLIYAANLGAVKEYDGRAWRTIPVPASWIMDLAAAPDGRIYVAGVDELGWLEPGPDGRRAWHSILAHVPGDLQPLGQLWAVMVHEGATYWSTNRVVLRWRDGALRTWTFPAEGRRVIHAGGKHLYLASNVEGVLRLTGDTWTPVSTAPPALELPSAVLDDWGATGLTLVARDGVLWQLDATGSATVRPAVLAAAVSATPGARLADTIPLRDGRLAILTKNAGLFVLHPRGEIDLRFGAEGGLDVLNLFGGSEDSEGGLWIGTANGLVRVELDPSLTLFDHKNGGPPGNMYRLVRHDGRLFACGQDGLYRFAPGAAGAQGRFERVAAEAEFIPYDLLSHPSGLLVASDRGLFRYTAGVITPEFSGTHSIYTLAPSVTEPARIFISGTEFIHTLRWDGTAWQDEGPITTVQEDGRSLVEDQQGVLWMGTPARGVVRLRRAAGNNAWQSAQADRFDTDRGLPAGHDWVTAYATPLGPLFTHAHGVAEYDPATDRLRPAQALTAAGLDGRTVYPLTAGDDRTLWLQLGQPTAGEPAVLGGLRRAAGGGWAWEELPAGVYSALGYMGAGDLRWEPGASGPGVLWVLGQQNIVRWDLAGAPPARPIAPPAVALRSITRGTADLSVRPETAPRLEFAREPLRVRFASPVYALRGAVEYQYRLLGYDDRWSAWGPETEAAFTNLTGGAFTLEVRARRGGGSPGPVTAWAFAVRPPVWRSGPAFLAYVLAAGGLGWLLLRWRTAWLIRDRQRLEREVGERTAELALARDRAETANQAKTMFLASMSHELRTPLHAILGYSQLLGGDRTLPGEARSRIQIVATSGHHLLRLINEVLDLSKIEAGKVELRCEPFDLARLLGEVAAAQEARAAAKGLVFQRPALTHLPGLVTGDAPKLRQVLDNLLGNAVKFTARGEVRLSVVAAGAGRWRFEVSDTGPGIPAEDMPRLFEPFTQAPARTETAERGSGLGLTIAQRLVTLLGGSLQVASEAGTGSRFWFELPLEAAPGVRSSERRPARSPIGYDGPRRRVLAVDDVEANRWLFRDLLVPLGFEVELAASADEALARLAGPPPDLVLLDLRMPGTDGFTLARRVRRDPRLAKMKILAASASVFGHDAGEALAAGCDAFISKPFLPEDFFSRVAQLLDLTWREEDAAVADREESLTPALLEAMQTAARLGDVMGLREAFEQLRTRHPRAVGLVEFERAIEAFDTDLVARLAARGLPPTGPAA